VLTSWLAVDDGTDLWELIPGAFGHLRVLYAGLWDAGIDPVTLELCRLRIATLIGGAAELMAPDPRADVDETLIDALPSWPTSAVFSEAQRAALGFAEQYTLDAHGVTDEQAADMHRSFSPAQLTTLTMAVAVFDAMARMRAVVTTATGSDTPIDISLP
jgi:alkylhydroperoxidase family enzyme